MSFRVIADMVSNTVNRLPDRRLPGFISLSGFVPETQFIYTCMYTCFDDKSLSPVNRKTMPQISLYIDKETLEKVERAADNEQLSISKWVGKQLKKSLQANYPEDFQDLFGSIRDESFTIPDRKPADADAKRDSFL